MDLTNNYLLDATLCKCHLCDEPVCIPELAKYQRATCPRCRSILRVGSVFNYEKLFCISLTALVLMLAALPFPFIRFTAHGNENVLSLVNSMRGIYQYDQPLLALTLFLFILVIPLLTLGSGVILFASLWLRRFPKLFPVSFRIFHTCKPWLMVEVFVIGVLVSLLKVASLATIHLGLAFYVYCLFVMVTLLILTRIDTKSLWDSWEKLASSTSVSLFPTNFPEEKQQCRDNTLQCEWCEQVSNAGATHCPRCSQPLHARKKHSLSNTLAMLVTATILYVPANLLPVMSTYRFGEPTHSTILEGVWTFLHHGDYLIAAVIFTASVLIPLAKILSLSYLCHCVLLKKPDQMIRKTRLYQLTEVLGKWSMIDVFVVVILVSLVRVENIMFIQSGPGIFAFAAVVVLTMLAAEQFDPKLLWDIETPDASSCSTYDNPCKN